MFKIPVQNRIWEINTPQIMGILNITGDSFYENSRVNSIDLALEIAEKMIQDGATILDIGGQSTRPGATFVSPEQEAEKVVAIIAALREKFPLLLLSIDTFNSQVARAALKAGANIVNDISCGGFDSNMFKVVAEHKAGYIGMHLTGSFDTMHEVPERENVVEAIITYFKSKKKQLADLGIEHWVMDPGFGFGKTIEDNFTIVKQLEQLKVLNLPILLGVSRKSSIYKTLHITAADALNGTTVLNTVGLLNGANIIRVHDVKEAHQAVTLLKKIS
jgi:dihydropteroate synthase